jgi:hypothetical protein
MEIMSENRERLHSERTRRQDKVLGGFVVALLACRRAIGLRRGTRVAADYLSLHRRLIQAAGVRGVVFAPKSANPRP